MLGKGSLNAVQAAVKLLGDAFQPPVFTGAGYAPVVVLSLGNRFAQGRCPIG